MKRTMVVLLATASLLVGCESKIEKVYKLSLNQKPTFKMLNSRPWDYALKKLVLYGKADLSNSYYGGYSDARWSHFAVILRDPKWEGVYVYFRSKQNKNLFELLGRSDKDYYLKVNAMAHPGRLGRYASSYLGEGLSWKVLASRPSGRPRRR